MKKRTAIITFLTIISFFITASFAFAEGDAKLKSFLDELAKIDDKAANNASYTIESKAKKDGKEENIKMRAHFKNIKNFVMDMETAGQKIKVVITPEESWMYLGDHNVIMQVPKDAREQFDMEKQQQKRRDETGEMTKAKEGENEVYTIISKDKKKKTLATYDPKQGVYTKVVEYNEKGEVTTEAVFKDYKFGPVDEAEFKKPEGAETMNMPEPEVKEDSKPEEKDAKESKEEPKENKDGKDKKEDAGKKEKSDK